MDRRAEIRLRTDLVELIGETAALRRVKEAPGVVFVGFCPLPGLDQPVCHGRLLVDGERATWQCERCGRCGDCFDWVQARERLTIAAAEKRLAARLGGIPDGTTGAPGAMG